jgi:hypothetical protein
MDDKESYDVYQEYYKRVFKSRWDNGYS